jgi:hypothetical protein
MLPFVVILQGISAQEVNTENVRPGGVAGLFFLGLLVASVVLFRSMNRHLRVARENLSPRPAADQDPVDGPAGTGMDASRGSGGSVGAEAEADADDLDGGNRF